MRRKAFALLPIILALLTACGDSSEAEFTKMRDSVAAAETISATATVRAETGETVREYGLSVEKNGEDYRVTVLSPQEIAGVSLEISGEDSRISYDGLGLDNAEYRSDRPSAVTALPIVLDAITEGYMSSCGTEGGQSVVSLVPEDEYSLRLAIEGGAPQSADIIMSEDGRVLISCEFTEFEVG